MDTGKLELVPSDEGYPTRRKTLDERLHFHISQSEESGNSEVLRLHLVMRMLQEALSEELACVARCKHNHYAYMAMASEIEMRSAAEECMGHAVEEQSHADRLAERILELGGSPNHDSWEPSSTGSTSSIANGKSHTAMIREDLTAERAAIDGYELMLRHVGTDDIRTREMLGGILGSEKGHADGLVSLLNLQ